jgi:hypothetical protein
VGARACSRGGKAIGGRKIHTGPSGGKYYICRGRKVYTKSVRKVGKRRVVRRRVARKSYGKPCAKRYGRKIHTGKAGGKYYICKGRRVYMKKRASTRKRKVAVRRRRVRRVACNRGGKAIGGRKIHTGPSGGKYYICRGRKVYKK